MAYDAKSKLVPVVQKASESQSNQKSNPQTLKISLFSHSTPFLKHPILTILLITTLIMSFYSYEQALELYHHPLFNFREELRVYAKIMLGEDYSPFEEYILFDDNEAIDDIAFKNTSLPYNLRTGRVSRTAEGPSYLGKFSEEELSELELNLQKNGSSDEAIEHHFNLIESEVLRSIPIQPYTPFPFSAKELWDIRSREFHNVLLFIKQQREEIRKQPPVINGFPTFWLAGQIYEKRGKFIGPLAEFGKLFTLGELTLFFRDNYVHHAQLWNNACRVFAPFGCDILRSFQKKLRRYHQNPIHEHLTKLLDEMNNYKNTNTSDIVELAVQLNLESKFATKEEVIAHCERLQQTSTPYDFEHFMVIFNYGERNKPHRSPVRQMKYEEFLIAAFGPNTTPARAKRIKADDWEGYTLNLIQTLGIYFEFEDIEHFLN